MTNNTDNLSQQEWHTIFFILNKINSGTSSKPAFYEKFINSGLKYNYFSTELKQKISDFHEKNKGKNHKTISEEWSQYFDNDFNIKEHFNIFLLTDDYNAYHQKKIIEFIKEKIDEKDTFYSLNRFFLDDHHASKYHVLRKTWRELLEKYKYPVNLNVVQKIVDDSTANSVHKHSNTTDLILNLKMLVLGYIYNPNIKILEDYIVKYSKNALFEKKAFEYLEKKNIKLTINPASIEVIPFVKKEKIIYSVDLEPDYLLKKYSLTRKYSEIICRGFIDYIYTKIEQPLSNSSSFTIELKCSDENDYNNNKNSVLNDIAKLDKAVSFIKKNNHQLTATEITDFLIKNIEKIFMKETLDINLSQKPIQKKLKI